MTQQVPPDGAPLPPVDPAEATRRVAFETPPVEHVAIAENANVQMFRCSKGHVSPAIGWLFSAAMLGGDPSQGALRDRRFCYICMVEAFDKLDISEVERLT